MFLLLTKARTSDSQTSSVRYIGKTERHDMTEHCRLDSIECPLNLNHAKASKINGVNDEHGDCFPLAVETRHNSHL